MPIRMKTVEKMEEAHGEPDPSCFSSLREFGCRMREVLMELTSFL